MSDAQLEIARSQAKARSLNNIAFTQGSAYSTGLAEESFDMFLESHEFQV